MTGARREAALALSALRFLARAPAPGRVGDAPDRLARAARYFPLVGGAVGGAAALVWALAGLALPAPVAAALALAAAIWMTGALHEDGLADCADGLGGGATRERALEIMRDSRTGAYGALALILSVLIRWAALAALGPWPGAAALIAAHAAGRFAIVAVLAMGVPARPEGLGRGAAGVTGAELGIAAAIAAVIAGLVAGWPGIGAAALALILGALVYLLLRRRLGGYTGDGLGAAEQIAETGALVWLAGALA